MANNLSSFAQRAFTLIELLVVVAIISLLAAMLMPALKSARGQAKTVQCIANVKQICLGVSMYCDDNDGQFPLYTDGLGNYWPTLSRFRETYVPNPNIFFCPVPPPYEGFWYPTSYCVNKFVTNWNGDRSFFMYWGAGMGSLGGPTTRISEIALPSQAALIGHSPYIMWWYNEDRLDWPVPTGTRPKPHSNGVIIGFVDGHTEWMSKAKLDALDLLTLNTVTCMNSPEARQFWFGLP